MKSLFHEQDAAEVRMRIAKLRPENQRQWGRMNLTQALAHLSVNLEMALGDRRPPRTLIGRILGRAIKRKALASEAPMPRNSPTIKEFVMLDYHGEFATERARLAALLERFVKGGPAACTTHPHPFFGRLTPQEWAIFEYQHLDHHLRQFAG